MTFDVDRPDAPVSRRDALRLTLAASLLAAPGAGVEAEVGASIGRGLELVRETGARAYQPPLYELRARLASALGDTNACNADRRAALALFREIGAEAHAERLAAELE